MSSRCVREDLHVSTSLVEAKSTRGGIAAGVASHAEIEEARAELAPITPESEQAGADLASITPESEEAATTEDVVVEANDVAKQRGRGASAAEATSEAT